MNIFTRATAAFVLALTLSACSNMQELKAVDEVNLERFMGDWYVIANIPTFIEKEAHNAIESYRLDSNGTIATTFTFRKGGFDGPRKRYNPRGFVSEDSNAIWGMQFVWPIKADYRIIYLDEDYSVTVIGRNQRDYLWIMAREPVIDEAEYRRIVDLVSKAGYDVNEIRMVPQQW